MRVCAPAADLGGGGIKGAGLDVGQVELGSRCAAIAAVALPMPLAAPVIRQRFPRRSRTGIGQELRRPRPNKRVGRRSGGGSVSTPREFSVIASIS